MSGLSLLTIFLAGIFSGFVNVMAGGGSLLTLPLMVFVGLPMPIANATNRVAIFFQNTVATKKFYNARVLSIKEAISLALPALAGSLVGTSLAIELNPVVLQITIAVIISIMAFLLLFKPNMWEQEVKRDVPRPLLALIFFLIGVYGGFIQAGVGFLFLWALSGFVGHDLVHSNALKVSVILAYTVVSLILFISRGLVDFKVGLILASGSMIGGWMGVKFSVVKGNRWIRYILSTMVIVSAVKMIISAF